MPSKSDIMGVEPDGTRTDVWVLDELLADDDLDEGDDRHVIPSARRDESSEDEA